MRRTAAHRNGWTLSVGTLNNRADAFKVGTVKGTVGTMKRMLTNLARHGLLLAALAVVGGCTSYQYAKNVKFISFDGEVARGKGMGPVRGESCQSRVMGYSVNEAPTLDKAVANTMAKNKLRYISNVSTENSGFSAVVYARNCLVVKGTGFQ